MSLGHWIQAVGFVIIGIGIIKQERARRRRRP